METLIRILGINWIISLLSLCVDTEHSPFKAVMFIIGYFILSSIAFISVSKIGRIKK